MITPFHARGASAGTAKCSKAFSIPTTSPDRASRSTIGKSRRESPTVSAWSSGSNPGTKRGTSAGATAMKRRVSVPSTRQIRKKRLEATRKACRRSPRSSSSVNTGTKAPCSAESANSARTRLGIANAMVNADMGPLTPKRLAATTSRRRPARRESPVAKEKKAVLRASRCSRRGAPVPWPGLGSRGTPAPWPAPAAGGAPAPEAFPWPAPAPLRSLVTRRL